MWIPFESCFCSVSIGVVKVLSSCLGFIRRRRASQSRQDCPAEEEGWWTGTAAWTKRCGTGNQSKAYFDSDAYQIKGNKIFPTNVTWSIVGTHICASLGLTSLTLCPHHVHLIIWSYFFIITFIFLNLNYNHNRRTATAANFSREQRNGRRKRSSYRQRWIQYIYGKMSPVYSTFNGSIFFSSFLLVVTE